MDIKLHKNELRLIIAGVKTCHWLGHKRELCDRVLKKLDKALTKAEQKDEK